MGRVVYGGRYELCVRGEDLICIESRVGESIESPKGGKKESCRLVALAQGKVHNMRTIFSLKV